MCITLYHCKLAQCACLILIIGQGSSMICAFFQPFPNVQLTSRREVKAPECPLAWVELPPLSCHTHSFSVSPHCVLYPPQTRLLKWQYRMATESHYFTRNTGNFVFPDQMRFSYMSRKTSISSLCHLIKPKVTSVLNSSLRSYFKWTALPKPHEYRIAEVNFSKHF